MRKMSFKEACAVVADLFEAIPETWTSGALAKTERGHEVPPGHEGAVSWCVIGALRAVDPDSNPWKLLEPFANKLGYDDDSGESAVDANNFGGREVAIKMLRMAAGQIKA